MKPLEKFKGTISQGYVGNIQYHLELKKPCKKLLILLTYDQEKCTNPSSKLLIEMESAFHEYKPFSDFRSNVPNLLSKMKTEIQLGAFLNGEFIGNVHKPGTIKEMYFSQTETSPGCIYLPSIQGHLKIVVNFFQVLCDDTNYTLTIFGES